ncbi:MAG: hypothetical protein J5746_09285, partial [Victivallales bacterium]|nr:hypothetical protein [Victivallales bacterium]
TSGSLYNYVGDKEIYKCPTDEEDLSLAYGISNRTRSVHKISAYKLASSMPLFLEDGGTITHRVGLFWFKAEESGGKWELSEIHEGEKRHNNQTNITYVDGHVAPTSETWEELAKAAFKQKSGIVFKD